jgi:hypothetical protein
MRYPPGTRPPNRLRNFFFKVLRVGESGSTGWQGKFQPKLVITHASSGGEQPLFEVGR